MNIFAEITQAYMKVLITGTSQGIGKALAELYLGKGHEVVGLDRQASSIAFYRWFVVNEPIKQ